MGKRIVVTGGRKYRDADRVSSALSAVHKKHGIDLLIQGGAGGADRLCAEWAWDNGVPVATFNAEWKLFGLKAGPIRNQRMIDEGKPDAGIAFPGNEGTEDMVERIGKAKIPLWDLR